jgi:hypothetical protein
VLYRNEDCPIAILFAPVAELLKLVVAPIDILVDILPFPLLINNPFIEPVTETLPDTSNLAFGVVVPMPTLPLPLTNNKGDEPD